MNLVERCRIAESLFGHITWTSPSDGYCQCPGASFHTGKQAKTDCNVHLGKPAPTIHCHHNSCEGAIKKAKHDLQSSVGKAERSQNHGPIAPYVPSPEEKARQKAKEKGESLTRRSHVALPGIMREFELDPADLWESSPVRLMDGPDEDWRRILSLFPEDDVIWIGDVKDTGQPRHSRNFRTVTDWWTESKAPGPFVNPCSYKPGSISRCNDNVVTRRFLVVESDTLSKAQTCAVFNWCRQFMHLRAVVDTAGKSCHGWFDVPAPEFQAKLVSILPALEVDRQLFKPSQPVRLPGFPRGDKMQSLLYFDPPNHGRVDGASASSHSREEEESQQAATSPKSYHLGSLQQNRDISSKAIGSQKVSNNPRDASLPAHHLNKARILKDGCIPRGEETFAPETEPKCDTFSLRKAPMVSSFEVVETSLHGTSSSKTAPVSQSVQRTELAQVGKGNIAVPWKYCFPWRALLQCFCGTKVLL